MLFQRTHSIAYLLHMPELQLYMFFLCGPSEGATLSVAPTPSVRRFHASDFLEMGKL